MRDIDRCCLYWIRLPEHTDIFTQGYVGITNNFEYRLYQHINNSGNPKQYKNYRTEFRVALESRNFIATKILEATREYCLDVEAKLRPEWVVGWNLAKGGNGGFGTHGLTGCPEFKIFTYVKSVISDSNGDLWLHRNWCDSDGVESFVKFYKENKTDQTEMRLPRKGEVSENTVRFITRSEINHEINRKYDIGDGIKRSVSEIGKLLNIRPNTISTNLSRGYTIRQACGLDSKCRKVIIDGVEFNYDGNLTDFEIFEVKKNFEEGSTIRAISKIVPSSESNLSRLIKRFNFKRKINERTVD